MKVNKVQGDSFNMRNAFFSKSVCKKYLFDC